MLLSLSFASVIDSREVLVLHSVIEQPSVMEAGRRVVEPLTRLTVRSPGSVGLDPDVLDRCEGAQRFQCWLRAIDHLKSGDAQTIRYLAVFTVHRTSGSEPTRAALLLLDIDAAREAVRASQEADVEGVENRIYERSTLLMHAAIDRGDDALSGFFASVFDGELRARLSKKGYWAPNGSVVLHGVGPGLEIQIDGRAVGTTGPRATEVTRILVGERTIEVKRSNGDVVGISRVVVRRGEATELLIAPRDAPDPSVVRDITMYGGGIVAALGAGMLIWSVAAGAGARVIEGCEESGCTETTQRFVTVSDLVRGKSKASSRSGVLAAPLGYSLMLAGGTGALGAWLFDDDLAWVPIVLGLCLGSLSYGLSSALD